MNDLTSAVNVTDVNDIRDINVITTEIKTLVAQYRSITVAYAVEVGRRLTEAKSLLAHGEWSGWLTDKVDFSQRTANNFMRIYEEYGDTQITLFGAIPNSQTSANLNISQALILLALPASEREEFVAENDVENMSARELEKAIKEKENAEKRAAAAEAEALRAADEKKELADRLSELEDSDSDVAAAREQADNARREAEKAIAESERLKTELEKIKSREQKAKDKIKKLQDNPEIPPEALDKIKAEAEAEAAEKQKAEIEKASAEAQAKAQTAAEAQAQAESALQAAQQKIAELEKQIKISNPDIVAFKTAFETAQMSIDKMSALLARIRSDAPDTYAKLCIACGKLADRLNAEPFKE